MNNSFDFYDNTKMELFKWMEWYKGQPFILSLSLNINLIYVTIIRY